ncbi:carboxyl transferase domain-containing protein [Streptomyces cavernae]|uniref:carboxyl transferase domain-containing protein n=1 Tax=Streptomyces cavernae TaxID=2259034 RepID=UPI000FEBCDEB|nr:carboxyl transferase domain-containing protein [Streptomyces cavernae]
MGDSLPARSGSRAAIALVAADFTELPPPEGESTEPSDGPLDWDGYAASRARATERTGERESVVCGTATIGGARAVLISFEFGFLGGSLGERTGDRLEAAYAHARARRLPVVSLIATGGSRMQEGMRALVQLQRVAREVARTRAAGLPQLAVVRDPTTGGGWATLGAGADVVLALPEAQIGFAGSRVRPPDADPSAYTARAQLAAGAVDAVVPPEELRDTLALWLTLLTPRPPRATTTAPDPNAPAKAPSNARAEPSGNARGRAADAAAPAGSADPPDAAAPAPTAETGETADSTEPADSAETAAVTVPSNPAAPGPTARADPEARANPDAPAPTARTDPEARANPETLQNPQARAKPEAPANPETLLNPQAPANPANPAAADPAPPGAPEDLTDPPVAPAGGAPVPPPAALGVSGGMPATGWEAVHRARSGARPRARAYLDAYFTHRATISGDRCGGVDDGMLCGFGERDGRTVAYAAQCGTATRPAGYRTAARLIRLAGRLGFPVLTLVDTPGAGNDAEAERQGAGAAIAELFDAVATARTPVTTLVIGEGGSGGALALAAPGNTWATPDSYFSVIAPELAAAILKRPPGEVPATADQLALRPQDLVDLGVVRGIVPPAAPEPPGRNHPSGGNSAGPPQDAKPPVPTHDAKGGPSSGGP